MSVIYIVLPLSIVIAGAALGMFVWATKDGQFEDLDTPGSRILFEDEDLKEYDDSRS
ncbi:MAG TPA: cbb3-type cytochrome oxidase assembly protein CcoS [Myxococcales bacterium]|nr:cbb3-type cytochrome oxidase assembly protein CcoS [Deltaproteobacteria bacterium]MBU48645.1 cbb3-type cytochrome oxidase assembly protein CcoS [Deltaproteobacteria bacterium]HAA56333.1 cbb3-type cytochrome oxidase assembly protein CcoS [Myxococcales bacterium]